MTIAHSEPTRRYTYLIADLSSGDIRDEAQFSSVKFSAELNKPGGFNGTISIEPTNVEHITDIATPNRVTLANFTPGRTIVWVLRNSTPVWGGIIWGFQARLDSRVVDFAAQDFISYYSRRTINMTLTYDAATHDQFTIAEGLIDYAQLVAGGDIGTTVYYNALSGRKRDRTYWYFERKNIYEALQQLADVDDGFDFAQDVSGSQAGGLSHQLTLSYPYRGRVTDLVFDSSKNVRLLNWNQDGLRMANLIAAQGAGEGDEMTQATAADPGKLATYPLLEDVTMHKDVAVQQTIIDHAAQDLRRQANPVEGVEVEIDPDDDTSGLGSFIVGDVVRVKVDDGFINIDKQMRVMGYTVQVNENGRETMNVRLASWEGSI